MAVSVESIELLYSFLYFGSIMNTLLLSLRPKNSAKKWFVSEEIALKKARPVSSGGTIMVFGFLGLLRKDLSLLFGNKWNFYKCTLWIVIGSIRKRVARNTYKHSLTKNCFFLLRPHTNLFRLLLRPSNR